MLIEKITALCQKAKSEAELECDIRHLLSDYPPGDVIVLTDIIKYPGGLKIIAATVFSPIANIQVSHAVRS